MVQCFIFAADFFVHHFFKINMDAQQAQILLEKINALWRSINATPGPVSAIERDLMLSYIRQLYNVFLDFNHLQSLPAVPPPPKQQPAPPPAPAPTVVEVPAPEAPPAPAPVQPEPPRKPVEIPVPAPQPQVVVPPPAPKPQPAPPVPPAPTRSAGAYEGLFGAKSSNDLSDKLSKQPIADLTKAFAINDKLLYANDLFGKDQNAFADNVRQLNTLGAFESAKAHLIQLAQQYRWLDEERVETAQAFVQLVQRRYLA